ncbi:MAG: hypothetical protein GX427_01245 [Actinomycetales bacterium]|jgi:hypothetical protein|nr:hypothetical protein [Actinomycetales bacterium]
MPHHEYLEWNPEGENEFFVIVEKDGVQRFYRHGEDGLAAKAHAITSGGKLFRGRMVLRWETLQEIPLGGSDAY